MRRYLGLALAGLTVVACNEDADRDDPCNASNTFLYDSTPYCIVSEAGFIAADCPPDLPNGRAFDDFVACTDGESVPDEVEEEARALGFGGGVETCTDGETRPADDGCNTCMCSDGVWSCTEMACTPECTDGETRPADDGCNTCTCADGVWSCTEIACTPECTDGETRPADDGCNTCTCSGGIWACTALGCVSPLEVCLDACDECEDPSDEGITYIGETPEECMVIDFTCPPDAVGFSNECGCGCARVDTTTCVEGETRMESCNECVCSGGEWACDTADCSELEACLAECGVGCPAPAYQECTTTGMSYCNACEVDCYGLTLAADRQPCECPSLPGERVDYTLFEVPDTCAVADEFFLESAVAFSNEEAASWFNCEAGTVIDIEEGGGVLIRAVFNEHPDATIEGVYRDRAADTFKVHLTSPQYCGGPAPFPAVFYVLAPFGDETGYSTETCQHTQCEEFFP